MPKNSPQLASHSEIKKKKSIWGDLAIKQQIHAADTIIIIHLVCHINNNTICLLHKIIFKKKKKKIATGITSYTNSSSHYVPYTNSSSHYVPYTKQLVTLNVQFASVFLKFFLCGANISFMLEAITTGLLLEVLICGHVANNVIYLRTVLPFINFYSS